MMNTLLDFIDNDLLDLGYNYIIMENGVIIKTNYSNINNLDFKEDVEVLLVHIISDNTKINITINENKKIKITEIFYVKNIANVEKEILCAENSHLELITIETDKTDNQVSNNELKINVHTVLKEKAYINNMKLSVFMDNVECHESISLKGKKAEIKNYNIYLNQSGKTHNLYLNVTHFERETISEMTNYGICKNNSITNIYTNGYVNKGAKLSNVRQKSKGILLDKNSTISANPWLQIDEFDCLASHGAGIGAIDDEELYYLMSRGLSEKESQELIINGFVNPLYKEISSDKLKEKIMQLAKIF